MPSAVAITVVLFRSRTFWLRGRIRIGEHQRMVNGVPSKRREDLVRAETGGEHEQETWSTEWSIERRADPECVRVFRWDRKTLLRAKRISSLNLSAQRGKANPQHHPHDVPRTHIPHEDFIGFRKNPVTLDLSRTKNSLAEKHDDQNPAVGGWPCIRLETSSHRHR